MRQLKYKIGLLLTLFFLSNVEAQSSATAVADSLYRLGSYTKAINSYAAIGNEYSSLQIGRSYVALGNTGKAIAQYQGHVKKYPENTLAKFELGKLYDKTKNYEFAIPLFEELTAKSSENPEFHYYLGKSLQANLDYTNSNRALKTAITIDSTHLKSIYLLGKYYVGVEEPANATKIIELGLKTAPNDVALINLKALTKFDIGEYEIAATLFERLLELDEKKPFIYEKLGYAQANITEYEKAKSTYAQLADIRGYKADAFKGLGQVYLLEKKLDSAETSFLKSIEERKYIFDDEYRSLGRIARLKGETKKSLEYYRKAWEENTANYFNYWQVCVVADDYYQDPETKLRYYEKLVNDFEGLAPFLKQRAEKRITELKEEIHFSKN